MLRTEQLASSTVGCGCDPKLHSFHGLRDGKRSVDSSLYQNANPSDAVEHVPSEFSVCWPLQRRSDATFDNIRRHLFPSLSFEDLLFGAHRHWNNNFGG